MCTYAKDHTTYRVRGGQSRNEATPTPRLQARGARVTIIIRISELGSTYTLLPKAGPRYLAFFAMGVSCTHSARTGPTRRRAAPKRFRPDAVVRAQRTVPPPSHTHPNADWARGNRPGVRVGPTLLTDASGAFLAELGLFHEHGTLQRGQLIAIVKGTLVRGQSRTDTHALQITAESHVKPKRKSAPERHLWCFANEPPEKQSANAAFVALYTGSDVRQDLRSSDRVVAMGLFAAARIRPGEEIYVHYGTKSYANLRIGYTPGAAAVLSKEEIPRAELPAQVYGATFPRDALWA